MGNESEERSKRQRRPYSEPTLTSYGSISKLTQNGTGSGADGNSNPLMAMMCL